MRTIPLPCESWRAVIATQRETALPSMLDHADRLEQQLEQHGPNEPIVTLAMTDAVYLRSST